MNNIDELSQIVPSRHSLLSIVAKTNTGIVSNWSGINYIAAKKQIHTPTSIQEIINIVSATKGNVKHSSFSSDLNSESSEVSDKSSEPDEISISLTKLDSLFTNGISKIRIVGSGMSYESIFSTDNVNSDNEVVLDMCNFSGLIKINDNTATFGASTPVNDVISILGKHKRMMDCSPGVIGVQTLAGAISTGTHGQGMKQSCYADSVVSIDIILPDGRYVHIDDNTHHKDDSIPPLDVAVSSLGSLGIIIFVEITHSPRRVFTCRKLMCDYKTFIQNYEKWNKIVEYVKVWWFPETDKCHVWLIDEASKIEQELFFNNSKEETDEFGNITITNDLLEIEMDAELELNDTVDAYLAALYRDTGVSLADSEEHPHSLTLHRFANSKDVIGYSEQIVCKGIPVPQINCEIAVPMLKFVEATELLHDWAKLNPHKLHYPFIYRATGESKKTKLYPSYGIKEGIAYIGFLVYLASDGSVRDDGMETMHEIQKMLAEKCNGLPHMGKHFVPEFYNFSENNKGLLDISKWRKILDPNGIFSNSFLNRLFNKIDINSQEENGKEIELSNDLLKLSIKNNIDNISNVKKETLACHDSAVFP